MGTQTQRRRKRSRRYIDTQIAYYSEIRQGGRRRYIVPIIGKLD
jgi:hypothetical protein